MIRETHGLNEPLRRYTILGMRFRRIIIIAVSFASIVFGQATYTYSFDFGAVPNISPEEVFTFTSQGPAPRGASAGRIAPIPPLDPVATGGLNGAASISRRADGSWYFNAISQGPGGSLLGFSYLAQANPAFHESSGVYQSIPTTVTSCYPLAMVGVSTCTTGTGNVTITITGSSVTPTLDPAFFVSQVYLDVLNRQADTSGLGFWVGQLNSNSATREQLAAQFLLSQESANSGLFLIELYVAVLGRDPEYAGWKYWFDQINVSWPYSQCSVQQCGQMRAIDLFPGSPEFQNSHGSLSNRDFVALVYKNVLGRLANTAELDSWASQLDGNTITRSALIYQFIVNAEYTSPISARGYANLLYMAFLGRTADVSGLAYWTGVTSDPNALPQAVAAFLNSYEYLARF